MKSYHLPAVSQSCCQCCRTVLFVDNKSGIHVLYRGILQDSIRDIVHSVSIDDGKTFSVPERISDDNWVINGCPHTGPAMTENKNALHFVWFTGGRNKGCYYAKSANNGINFSPRDSISGLGSHPQIASFPGGEIIIVWDETVSINNKFYKRIGVQKRTTHGIGEKTGYITPDTLINSFPVISTLDEKNSLIAYSGKKGEKNYIAYQLINLK